MPAEDTLPLHAIAPRDPLIAMRRGWAQKCPSCGRGHIYGKFLKVAPTCGSCGLELHHHRADDAPPYFTMLIVGHVIVGLVLAVETRFHPDGWVHAILWGPTLVLMTLWLLPRIKGALIGYQWALRMHGFDGNTSPAASDVWPLAARKEDA